MYGDGTAIEPEIKGDLDCQYVTTDWELGTATMYYVLADGSLYQAKINVVSLTPADEPAPEVKGSIERDPANTGGELEVTIENDTVTFTSGEIKWYPEDKDLGRAAGNRVGVQINAPADFDTTGVTVKIGEQTYNWDEIKDGDGYFWWYPLVTQAGQQFTATVVWNESSTQEFKVVIGEGVTLEAAPDTTDPELKSVSPKAGDVNLEYGETLKLEVAASDENLYELEVDHNIAELPEFSVYASESDPYGGQGEAFAEAGVTVTYNAAEQKWIIDFGKAVTTKIVEKGGITFYLVLVDDAGNKWGSMDPTTPENTFAYNVTQDEAPEVSTYKFSYEVPGGIVAGEEVEVDVTFATVEEGDYGYEGVRFKFAAQGPEGATVTFKAVDSNNDEYTFTNEGYWGPPGGFELPAQYSATTEWTLVFSEAGDYTITFSLVDLDIDRALVTQVVEVTVGARREGAFGKNAVTTKKHGAVDGYIVDIRLTDGVTFSGAQVEVSLVDADGNVMQKNTLKEDHGITGTSLTCPFDVRGSFDYQEDGYWQVEESVKGNYKPPAKVVIKVVLANGKVLVDELTSITPIPLDIQVKGNGFVNAGSYKGVFVEISLPGTDNDKIESVTVELYNEDHKLIGTNTLNDAKKAGGPYLTSPFVVIPGDYTSKSWTTVWEDGEPRYENPPAYALITVVGQNGMEYTAEKTYMGDWSSIWVQDITVVSANDSGMIDSEAYRGITATFTLGGTDLNKVQSVEVKLFDADDNLLATTRLRSEKFPLAEGNLTAPIVAIVGTYQYGSWEKTQWTDGNPDPENGTKRISLKRRHSR